MKITLAFPRFQSDSNPPLGIAYIASFLREGGYNNINIIDQTFEGKETLEKNLRNTNPDILMISCLTLNYRDSIEMATLAKKINPNIMTIMGGGHSTVDWQNVIKNNCIDFIVLKEGEITSYELIKTIENNGDFSKIKGIVYKNNGKFIKTEPRPFIENLDELPFPARDLLPMDKYLHAQGGRSAWAIPEPSTTIISSRGCCYNCTYCGIHTTMGPGVRFRSPENVIEELIILKEKYKIKGFYFWDDTFTVNFPRLHKICDLIIENKLDLEWCIQARVNCVNEEILTKMRKAGLKTICYGIESGSQRILDEIYKKGITLEQVRTAVKISKKLGLIVQGYFMIGAPTETMEEINQTINFAKSLDLDAAEWAIVTPFLGTELRRFVEENNLLLDTKTNDLDTHSISIIKNDNFNSEILRNKLQEAIRSFYFRPKYILKKLLKVRSWDDLKRNYKGLRMVTNILKYAKEKK